MTPLKLTKNITGKPIRIMAEDIYEYEQGEVNEDPEAKAKTPAPDKKVKSVTIIRRKKLKEVFVTETPEQIDELILKRHIKISL